MRKNILTTIVLAGIVLINVNCGGHKENETAAMQAVPVKVSPVSTEGENSYVTASGTVEAANNANLSTRMMGFVNKVYVKVGDKVRKGQLLIAINNADLQAKLAQVNAGITEATAAYTNAEKDYNRF
ncbi:MAG: biotin/lipoyl-binding protein, partial [Flavobacteriaceae bacterium]|nr:biotin/lipoyl-binding protein [Flavobacteriaceae bacterium]